MESVQIQPNVKGGAIAAAVFLCVVGLVCAVGGAASAILILIR